MADITATLGAPDFGEFDYTFTDKELQDVLGYMEQQQSGSLVDPMPFGNPSALQFQPHPTSSLSFSQPSFSSGAGDGTTAARGGALDVMEFDPLPGSSSQLLSTAPQQYISVSQYTPAQLGQLTLPNPLLHPTPPPMPMLPHSNAPTHLQPSQPYATAAAAVPVLALQQAAQGLSLQSHSRFQPQQQLAQAGGQAALQLHVPLTQPSAAVQHAQQHQRGAVRGAAGGGTSGGVAAGSGMGVVMDDSRGVGALPAGLDAPPGQQSAAPSQAGAGAPHAAGATPAAAAAPAVPARKDGRPQVSHSTVEKQRRDRINSLIDELRDLVPPSRQDGTDGPGQSAVQDSSDVKRPKHVVLSDTIAMVKELQERLNCSEARLARIDEGGVSKAGTAGQASPEEGARGGGAGRGEQRRDRLSPHHAQQDLALSGGGGAGGSEGCSTEGVAGAQRAQHSRDSVGSGSRESHPDLPLAPEGGHAPEVPAVGVEAGEGGCLFVKVSCKDRHGLLSDIVRALKSAPLEIMTAAVTTTPDGGVYDVFQVSPEGGSTLSPEDIAARVRDVLEATAAGDKRRRGSF